MSVYRRYVTVLGVIAAVILFWMENPWWNPESVSKDLRSVATIAFWVLFIAVLVLMFEDRKNSDATEVQIEGPAFARYLFSNRAAGLFWLPIRLFVGFAWVEAGWHKVTGGAGSLMVGPPSPATGPTRSRSIRTRPRVRSPSSGTATSSTSC